MEQSWPMGRYDPTQSLVAALPLQLLELPLQLLETTVKCARNAADDSVHCVVDRSRENVHT